MIYVSSLAFGRKPVDEIVLEARDAGLNLEFSSSLPYHTANEESFLNYSGNKKIHNYFPAPQDSFVLNLASGDSSIRQRTIDHAIHALQLTNKAGTEYYSIHAGFCIDPKPEQLGRQLSVDVVVDREAHWKLFVDSVKEVLGEAEKLGLKLYIENNVLAPFNYSGGFNPLFCCDAKEMNQLCSEINHPSFGILLDTAHLKVSAKTLGFDADKAVEEIRPNVKVIHHSDNDGLKDNNQAFDEAYWFNKFLIDFRNIDHVIEVRDVSIQQIRSMIEQIEN